MNSTEEMSLDRSAKLEETTRIVLDASGLELAGASELDRISEGDQQASELTGPAQSGEFVNEFAKRCAAEALQLLSHSGALETESSERVLSSFERHLWSRTEETPVFDILVFLLQPGAESPALDGNQFEDLDLWSNAVIEAFKYQQRVTKLPFLHQTRPPSIYKEIPEVRQFCQTLMCPIVQAQQNDLVTIASINPVLAVRVAKAVAEMVEDAVGRPPIGFGAVCDAESWENLNRNHFGL